MVRFGLRLLAILLCCVVSARTALSDAIVVTKAMSATTVAEVFVEDVSVRVVLEIGADDIDAFQNIIPQEIYEKLNVENPLPQVERQKAFFSQDLVLRTNEEILPGKLVSLVARKRIVRDEITGDPLAVQPEDGPLVIYAELEYALTGKPDSISIQPPTDKDKKFVSANIGFITYHRGMPVMEFRYLSQLETLQLDWEDPWYSQFNNRNLKRQYDAPMSVFLYVEPFEVRVEVVARPVDLQRWTDLGVSANQVILIAQQANLKTRAGEFLRDKIELKIDGRPVAGSLDRIHFIRRTLRKTGVVFPDQDLDASSATLGIIFVFPINRLPDQVSLTWKLFDERIQKVPSVATDEAGGLPASLTRDDPVLTWKNFLVNPTIPAMLALEPPPAQTKISLPLLSISFALLAIWSGFRVFNPNQNGRAIPAVAMLIGIGGCVWFWPDARIEFANPIAQHRTVSSEQATDIMQSLMHNLYHSFDRRDESVVYDQLATCVSGELLREIYIQVMQQIQLEDQGGARVKVDEIDFLSSQSVPLNDSTGFSSNLTWNVSGTVGHWGHLHSRTNQYSAEFGVEPVDGKWKIVSLQITDVAGLETQPAVNF